MASIKERSQDKNSDKSEVKKAVKGEVCQIGDKSYFVRSPKAKDMIVLEQEFLKHKSSFAQGLILVAHLCEDISYEDLEDMYIEDLNEVFEVFDKLMNIKKPASSKP